MCRYGRSTRGQNPIRRLSGEIILGRNSGWTEVQWIDEIVGAMQDAPAAVVATDYLTAFNTFSQPVGLLCNDSLAYVVKGRHVTERAHLTRLPRAMFTDQVVGRLGAAMGAPVGRVVLVKIPTAFIATEPNLAHLRPGIAHGCEMLPGVHDGWPGTLESPEANRSRFASLALLYGWFEADDHQFLYRNAAPFEVYSVDHGHFLPGGPSWSRASLRAARRPTPDPQIIGAAQMGQTIREELLRASAGLRGINDAVIARAVAAPPATWGVSVPERVALARYLSARRTQLLDSLK